MKSFLFLCFFVALLALVGANSDSDSPSVDRTTVSSTPSLSSSEEMERQQNEAKWTQNLESATQKLARLSSLKQGTPDWVALSVEVRNLLRGTADFNNKAELVEQYRSLVGPYWRGTIDKAAEAFMEVMPKKWGAEMDRAFLEEGSDIEVSIKKEKVGYVAYVQYAFMSRALVYKLANLNNGVFLSSAREAGFEKVIFKNTISGTTWAYEALEGKQNVKAALLVQVEKDHYLN